MPMLNIIIIIVVIVAFEFLTNKFVNCKKNSIYYKK